MQENWKNWCRLCGSSGITIKLEGSSTLQYHFKITENNIKICEKCNSYVSGFEEFLERSENVQALFQELPKFKESLNLEKLNELRIKFNLNPFEVPTKLEDFETELKDEKQEAEDNVSDHEFNFDHLHDQFSNDSDSEAATKQKIEPEIHYIPEAPIVEEPIQRPKRSKYRKRTKKSLYRECSDEDDEKNIEEDPDFFPEEMLTAEERKNLRKTGSTSYPTISEPKVEKMPKEPKSAQPSKVLPPICHICQEIFISMLSLQKHTKEAHNCLPAVLCVCGVTLVTHDTYTRHRKRCFGNLEAQYECDHCIMRYFNKKNLEKHMECRHMSTSKKYDCPTCGKEYITQSDLSKHQVTHLPAELRETFDCPHCPQKCFKKSALRTHLKYMHSGPAEKNVICSTCGKGFKTLGGLKSHQESHNTTLNYSCEVCDMQFKTKPSLQSHIKAHGPKTHFCKICGMRFRRGTLLTKHKVVHSDEKPFKCPYEGCGKAFKRKVALRNHINSSIHQNIQKHICRICGQGFNSNSNCKRHRSQMHRVEYEIELKEKETKRKFLNTNVVDRRFEPKPDENCSFVN